MKIIDFVDAANESFGEFVVSRLTSPDWRLKL